MQLTSSKNPLLQAIRRAGAHGRPTEDGLLVAEGPHLIAEAARSAWRIEQIFTTAQARGGNADLLAGIDAEIVEVSPRAFASMSTTEASQEALALLRPKTWTWADLLTPAPALVMALDHIQDPGNGGALVRSAEAFGATGVVFLDGSVRISNGKFLRATAGSVFRVPYLEGIAVDDFLAELRASGAALYALAPRAATSLWEADLRIPCALAVGSEGHGLSPELLAQAHPISLPAIQVESLNAAVAGSIALFEARRQRISA
jgi:RNA methyltransferase, TrmH family